MLGREFPPSAGLIDILAEASGACLSWRPLQKRRRNSAVGWRCAFMAVGRGYGLLRHGPLRSGAHSIYCTGSVAHDPDPTSISVFSMSIRPWRCRNGRGSGITFRARASHQTLQISLDIRQSKGLSSVPVTVVSDLESRPSALATAPLPLLAIRTQQASLEAMPPPGGPKLARDATPRGTSRLRGLDLRVVAPSLYAEFISDRPW